MKINTDIRKDLYSNIVLLGWNYMFIGIGKYMVRKACRGSQDHYTSTHKVGFS